MEENKENIKQDTPPTHEEEKEVEEVKEDEKVEKADRKTLKREKKLEQQISFLEAENAKLKTETEQWKNKYYEAYANLANTRKSLDKDHEQMVKYRASGFIDKILPALDSFEMAFKVEPKDPVIKNFSAGFKMILSQLEQGLKDEGVSFVDPHQGEAFNEHTMHAVQTVDGEQDNLVSSTYAKGYMLHDRLLRPAMVIVTKKVENKEENKPEESKPQEENK